MIFTLIFILFIILFIGIILFDTCDSLQNYKLNFFFL